MYTQTPTNKAITNFEISKIENFDRAESRRTQDVDVNNTVNNSAIDDDGD
eukprot:m.75462 g.75462  ORF g.75462 m.75462 type:complete len:50 (-) comp24789_c0_seq1:29-178(-)